MGAKVALTLISCKVVHESEKAKETFIKNIHVFQIICTAITITCIKREVVLFGRNQNMTPKIYHDLLCD